MKNEKQYASIYNSELGKIIIVANGNAITSIWFDDHNEIDLSNEQFIFEDITIIKETQKWLDLFFLGKDPGPIPNTFLSGSEFQMKVWNIIRTIPYGKTITYKDIANIIVDIRGEGKMSAQAVGGAVGKNPIPILIPCHRVMGKNGKLTGFGCGIERKVRLLEIEKNDISKFHM